ncbi:MAG: hypothetical protein KIT36_01790 [Alphaproteobacteria bacterium]|nr:hypothetical protein [Alphaproteobacteria bacterium]
MRWRLSPLALAAALLAATPVPSLALELTGRITCTWKEAGQDCSGTKCYNSRNTGERTFQVDFESQTMCPGREKACAHPLKFAVAQREVATRTAILIAHAPDGALMYRVDEAGRIIGVVMAGMERILIAEGTCTRG